MPPATRTRKATTTARRKPPVVINEKGEPDEEGGQKLAAELDHLRDEAALELRQDDPDYDDFEVEDAEVPDSLVFTSDFAAQEKRETDPGTVFEFDGRRFRAFKPKDTVMVTLIAASSTTATVADQVDAVLKWLDHCLEPTAKMHLQSRLYDRDDPIEWEDLAQVMLALLEHWDDSGRAERRGRRKMMREAADERNAAGRPGGPPRRPRR